MALHRSSRLFLPPFLEDSFFDFRKISEEERERIIQECFALAESPELKKDIFRPLAIAASYYGDSAKVEVLIPFFLKALAGSDKEEAKQAATWLPFLYEKLSREALKKTIFSTGTRSISFHDGGGCNLGLPIHDLIRETSHWSSFESRRDYFTLEHSYDGWDIHREEGMTRSYPSVEEFFQARGLKPHGVPEKKGRSYVYDYEGDKNLVIKYANEKNSAIKPLVRELIRARQIERLQQRGEVQLWSERIQPLDKSPVFLKLDGKKAISFFAPQNYYRYLDEKEVPPEIFFNGLGKGIHDYFELAKKGWIHTAPFGLFHNNDARRPEGGEYCWSPGVFFWGANGMHSLGRLHDWPKGLEYGNVGWDGLRDPEEICSHSELMNWGGGNWQAFAFAWRLNQPRYDFTAVSLPNEIKYIDNNILIDTFFGGNMLLGSALMMGGRAVMWGDHSPDLWQDENELSTLEENLKAMYALAFSVRNNLDYETALSIMEERGRGLGQECGWKKYARSLLFFMTPAHAPYMRPNFLGKMNLRRKIDWSLFYENYTEVTFGTYREKSFDSQVGYVGHAGKKEEKSLGPVNGVNPVIWMERMGWLTLLKPMEYELEKKYSMNRTPFQRNQLAHQKFSSFVGRFKKSA